MHDITHIKQLICYLPIEHSLFVDIDDYLIVDMDIACNRYYHVLGVEELLYEIGHRGRNRCLVFLFRDGANYELSGRPVVEKSIRQLELTEDTCVVVHYGPINIPGATVVDNQSWRVWQNQINRHIAHLPLADDRFNLHFSALFGRFDMYRLKLYRHLYEHHSTKSLLAFNTNTVTYGSRFTDYFADDLNWASQHLPAHLDLPADFNANGHVPHIVALEHVSKIYQNYFIEVIVETDPLSSQFVTEKTIKNFWLGKPFILFSGRGTLEYLRQQGFKTFGTVIDEHYDTIKNDYDRLNLVKAEIDRIASMSLTQLQHLHSELVETFAHNREMTQAILNGQNVQ